MAEPDGGLGGVTIGAREIYDELVALRGDVRSLTETREMTQQEMADMRSRLTTVERWIWSAPAALLTGVATAAVVLMK